MFVEEEVIAELNADMKTILDAECKSGNTVVETSRSWPIDGGLNVWLKRSFSADYSYVGKNVTYNYLGDPHNGEAEYCDQNAKQIITAWGR